MTADLILVALMGAALTFTGWMWVPPRRSSGLEPAPPEPQRDTPAPTPMRSGQMQRSPAFADLVTIGAVERAPLRFDIPVARKPPRLRDVPKLAIGLDGRRPAPPPPPTREQLVAALLGDDTDPGDDPTPEQEPEEVLDEDSEPELPPMGRSTERREADLRAARYGLVRLDGGVKWAGEDQRIDTLPPAAVEDD